MVIDNALAVVEPQYPFLNNVISVALGSIKDISCSANLVKELRDLLRTLWDKDLAKFNSLGMSHAFSFPFVLFCSSLLGARFNQLEHDYLTILHSIQNYLLQSSQSMTRMPAFHVFVY
jgi:hypothetical protein